jgi:hypothetical protein
MKECPPNANEARSVKFRLYRLVVPHPKMLRITKRRSDEALEAVCPAFLTKARFPHECQRRVLGRVANIQIYRMFQIRQYETEYSAKPQ